MFIVKKGSNVFCLFVCFTILYSSSTIFMNWLLLNMMNLGLFVRGVFSTW